mgnify:CR=1 FL=1
METSEVNGGSPAVPVVPLKVCVINQYGEWICPPKAALAAEDAQRLASLSAIFGPNLPANKLKLMFQLCAAVAGSPIGDECIPARSDEAVQSVRLLLGVAPPALMTYRYYSVAGDFIAAHMMLGSDTLPSGKTKYHAVREVLDAFKVTIPAC